MKIIGVLFAFGLVDACFGHSMKPETIKMRYREAKYAFKLRVVSEVTEECFSSSFATTTTTSSPPTTKTLTTMPYRTSAIVSAATTETTRQVPTSKVSRSTITQAETTSTTRINGSDITGETKYLETTTLSSIAHAKSTNNPATPTGLEINTTSSTANPRANPTNSEELESNRLGLESLDNQNRSENMEQSRRKRSCETLIRHQDIIIRRKHIYKGCNEIYQMKRVKAMDKTDLASTIRLQMSYDPEEGLKPNRNYFFMGRAVPGQNSSDYVFMADKLTVVNWKSSAWKLKKYLRANGGRCRN